MLGTLWAFFIGAIGKSRHFCPSHKRERFPVPSVQSFPSPGKSMTLYFLIRSCLDFVPVF